VLPILHSSYTPTDPGGVFFSNSRQEIMVFAFQCVVTSCYILQYFDTWWYFDVVCGIQYFPFKFMPPGYTRTRTRKWQCVPLHLHTRTNALPLLHSGGGLVVVMVVLCVHASWQQIAHQIIMAAAKKAKAKKAKRLISGVASSISKCRWHVKKRSVNVAYESII